MKFFEIILNTLFPNKCICCGEIIENGEFLCEYCFEMIENIDLSKICLSCGYLKKDCRCNSIVHHFAGAVSPFQNKKDGFSRRGMYRLKFKKLPRAAKFFANEMAKAVKVVYNDIDFDGIAFVPMHPKKQLKRGFNQSEVLAKELAKILNLKIYDRLLSAKYVAHSQHQLSVKERFKNVKGIYSANYKVTGKTILLVDDIKTTVATLDECAKQLLLAGADNVYCVSGLITFNEKGKK